MTVNGFRKYSLEIWRSSNHAQINLHDQMAPTRDVRECRSCHSTKMCWNWPSTAHHTEAQDSGSAKGGISTCSSYQFPGLIKIYGWGGIFINTVFEDTFTRFRFGPKGDPYNESNWDHAPSTSSSYGHMPSVDTPPNVGPCLGLPRLSTSALAEYKCWIKNWDHVWTEWITALGPMNLRADLSLLLSDAESYSSTTTYRWARV